MIRIFLFIAVLALCYWALFDWRRTDPNQRRQKGIVFALYGLALAILLMVLTGRAHILMAPIAIALPYIRRFAFSPQGMSWIMNRLKGRMNAEESHHVVAVDMDGKEARQVLGFESSETPTAEQIKRRHRALIQKVHPDREDGSDFLAIKINTARDILLSELQKSA